MTNLSQFPGYIEAFTANSTEVASFEPNQPQFHWNVVNKIRRFIEESEGEAKGWRRQVTILIAEKSWVKLGFESLSELLQEALGMTPDDFVKEVEIHAGPDMVDLVSPHLGLSPCNTDLTPKQRQHEQRQAANAPEIAVRLRASDLITEADMRYLGKLNADEAHHETLQLIEDRLVELGQPDGSTETDRRRYRAKVKGVIQAVAPAPQPKTSSKVVRFPDNAERALAIIQEHLSLEEQDKLRLMLCGKQQPEKKPRSPRPADQMLTYEDALEQVTGLKDGAFTTTRVVIALVGETNPNIGRFNSRFKDGGEATGNGWIFKKHTADEMTAMGFGPKAASWEIIEYGQG